MGETCRPHEPNISGDEFKLCMTTRVTFELGGKSKKGALRLMLIVRDEHVTALVPPVVVASAFEVLPQHAKKEPAMGQTQYRSIEVAQTLSRFIRADLADDLALALINSKFPGMSGEELLRVFRICQDEAALEYERSQEVLASVRETTTGYAALFALVDLWRSQSEEQRRAISDASIELAETLNRLQAQLATTSTQKGAQLLANLYSQRPVNAAVMIPKSG